MLGPGRRLNEFSLYEKSISVEEFIYRRFYDGVTSEFFYDISLFFHDQNAPITYIHSYRANTFLPFFLLMPQIQKRFSID